MNQKAVFSGWTCIEGPAEFVNYLVRNGEQVTYRTFAAHVDLKTADLDRSQRSLLPRDWSVTWLRTKLPLGEEAWVMQHSGIEHLFVYPGTDWEEQVELAVQDQERYDDEYHARRALRPNTPPLPAVVKEKRFRIRSLNRDLETARLDLVRTERDWERSKNPERVRSGRRGGSRTAERREEWDSRYADSLERIAVRDDIALPIPLLVKIAHLELWWEKDLTVDHAVELALEWAEENQTEIYAWYERQAAMQARSRVPF